MPRPVGVARRQPAKFSYLGVYRASPFERIEMIKSGILATEVKRIFRDLAIGQGEALKALRLSPATVNKKAKQDQILSRGETERVIGIVKLVGQLEAMIQESGNPEGFDAVAWMARWLKEPLPAFGGVQACRSNRYHGGAGLGVHSAYADAEWRLRVSRTVWRIAADAPSYEAHGLSGAGAKTTGGRWNKKDIPVVYNLGNSSPGVLGNGSPLERRQPSSQSLSCRSDDPGRRLGQGVERELHQFGGWMGCRTRWAGQHRFRHEMALRCKVDLRRLKTPEIDSIEHPKSSVFEVCQTASKGCKGLKTRTRQDHP